MVSGVNLAIGFLVLVAFYVLVWNNPQYAPSIAPLKLGIQRFLSQLGITRMATGGAVTGTITQASELMSSGTLNAGDAAGVVIWIPNEGHEPAGEERMAEVNGTFLPETLIVGTGAQVVWLSDDVDHEHNIQVTGVEGGGSVSTDAHSEAMTFSTAGTFAYSSEEYEGQGQTGSIQVTETPVTAGSVVGALFCPQDDESTVTSTLTGAGMTVLSKHPFSYGAADNTLCIVYEGTGTATEVAEALTAVTKATPYS